MRKKKMKNELSIEEMKRIKKLEDKGYTVSEMSHAILHDREADTYEDIKAQIKRLLK